MKPFPLILLMNALLASMAPAQSGATLYNDQIVSSIYLDLPADSLNQLIGTLENDHYYSTRFIFDDGATRDTVDNTGLRLRGNTSLNAAKKSFKLSFNEYEPGREYQGVRKLNLRAQQNDPTMVREKLFYDVWKTAGMSERRASFVRLYINGAYRGLYTNIEEIDKQWVQRHYAEDEGNLFKCTWPASLEYLGPDPATYKALMNNPEERAYDLKTNEDADDYSRLVELIERLHQPVGDDFADQISQILNVDQVLKAYAIDVATGNWDDYFYLQNNYYLYDNPATGRFEFVTYDTDNSFGIDWIGVDWAKRNALTWQNPSMPRPMATQLLAVPAFREKFALYLDSVARFVTLPDSIFPHIDALHALVSPAVAGDAYHSLDFGYTLADFHEGFEQTVDGHTPYGIKPFLALRGDSTLSQIAGLVSDVEEAQKTGDFTLRAFPNPATESVFVQLDPSIFSKRMEVALFTADGKNVWQQAWEQAPPAFELPLSGLPQGVYFLQWSAGKSAGRQLLLKN